MAEYAIALCVDRNGVRPLPRDTAVFVRRIQPALDEVYTIICDDGGRARPWQVTRGDVSTVHTGAVHIATESTYLAVWIPAAQLAQQGDVARELAGLGRTPRYEFQPSSQDASLFRVQAVLWQGGTTPLSAADAALARVLREIGQPGLAPQVIASSDPIRREFARLLIAELDEVKARELTGSFIIGQHDTAGLLRDALLTNPEYRGATMQRRLDMITEWQRQLQLQDAAR